MDCFCEESTSSRVESKEGKKDPQEGKKNSQEGKKNSFVSLSALSPCFDSFRSFSEPMSISKAVERCVSSLSSSNERKAFGSVCSDRRHSSPPDPMPAQE